MVKAKLCIEQPASAKAIIIKTGALMIKMAYHDATIILMWSNLIS